MKAIWNKLLHREKIENTGCTAIIAAAGSSTRMAGEDKILLPLRGEPVLAHTLRQFQNCKHIDDIIVVTREDLILSIGNICKDYSFTKVSKIIVGGATRTESVYRGICEVSATSGYVAIQDGARPFVTEEIIVSTIKMAQKQGAAAPAIPLKDTIKRVERHVVTETIDRAMLQAVQTPQVFDLALIKGALHNAMEYGVQLTDDCSAVERLGMSVVLTKGSEENIKITTPMDMIVGEGILQWRDVR